MAVVIHLTLNVMQQRQYACLCAQPAWHAVCFVCRLITVQSILLLVIGRVLWGIISSNVV